MTASGGEGFPRGYLIAFALVTVPLIGGGFLLWLPESDGSSTAQSDLGLTLMGGGMAGLAGFAVAMVIFNAERRLGHALRQREQAAEVENLKLTLSMSHSLQGIDLRGRNLTGATLRQKRLDNADLRQANFSQATFGDVMLDGALLRDADLRDAALGSTGAHVSLIDADLTGADLRGARIRGDIRRAVFDSADLRGTDLRHSNAVHPHPETASPAEVAEEATVFDGAKYDANTKWPDGVDPTVVGAVSDNT